MIKNFFRNLYPLTKFYLAAVLLISAFILPNYIYGYLLIAICGIVAYFYEKLGIYLKRVFFSLFFLTLIIFAVQGLMIPSNDIMAKFGFITVYKTGIITAVRLTSKIAALVSTITMLTLISKAKEFTVALEKKGLNPKAAFILLLSLQMIPEMNRQANIILDSQKSRGVETEGNIFVRFKALIPVFIPLVLGSIVNTEERAITLEARGFSIGKKRTILNELEETKNDKIVKIILAIFIILCVVWRILWLLK
ncbi:energy-coupling factor transporter transmembrane component T [Leptotrichia sp. oral taxon 847]|uniref:energy-coupling factor transporter transmembrane component T n=1 Tax=Leptotrichia sp. oral taxon 847 TaxID=1785996 RepID=UPI000767EA04|nr:energy-coupling factor transporter transmembrane component T [Leptotrichia sp. oral taxon 847]AMD95283.1 cobalt transporter [Leptotrichia sp. oral taxon 847]